MEIDEGIKKFLNDVMGAVEANSYEHHSLWSEYSQEYKNSFMKGYNDDRVRFSWKQGLSGHLIPIGEIGGLEIWLSLFINEVDGHKILFYYVTSRASDSAQVEDWLKKNLPETAKSSNGWFNKTDAMNFCNILHDIRHRLERVA